jgi:sugar diacid utilization regulator
MLRDTLWGYVVLAEVGARFGAVDKHIVRRAATTVALELTAERRASASEWDGRASLASDLLRGDRNDVSLEKRAQFFGVDLAARRVVCLLADDSGDAPGSLPSASAVADAFRADGDCEPVLATGVAEGVVAILRLPDDGSARAGVEAARRRGERAVRALGISDTCLVAMSAACLDAAACSRAYRDARQVLGCMRLFASQEPTRIMTADDLGAGRVFLASVDRAEAEHFAVQTLQSMLDECEAPSVLLDTLQVFFENSRSVRGSAAALDVHENTIRYRLARVEAATGLDVAGDSSDQLTAQLALLVLQLQGKRPWHASCVTC